MEVLKGPALISRDARDHGIKCNHLEINLGIVDQDYRLRCNMSSAEAGLAKGRPSARALEFARGIARGCSSAHAGFADIDALLKLPGIVTGVQLRDACLLLLRVHRRFRTTNKADRA